MITVQEQSRHAIQDIGLVVARLTGHGKASRAQRKLLSKDDRLRTGLLDLEQSALTLESYLDSQSRKFCWMRLRSSIHAGRVRSRLAIVTFYHFATALHKQGSRPDCVTAYLTPRRPLPTMLRMASKSLTESQGT
jgi:hypothetical protein